MSQGARAHAPRLVRLFSSTFAQRHGLWRAAAQDTSKLGVLATTTRKPTTASGWTKQAHLLDLLHLLLVCAAVQDVRVGATLLLEHPRQRVDRLACEQA